MFLYILVKMASLDYLWIAENRFGMKKKKKRRQFSKSDSFNHPTSHLNNILITIPNCTNLVSLKSRHHKLYNDTENTKNGGREGCQSSAQS